MYIEHDQTTRDFIMRYNITVLDPLEHSDMSNEANCCDSDVVDLEWDTGADTCGVAFRNAVGAFPPEAADIQGQPISRGGA